MTKNKGDLISREALKKAVINNFDNVQVYFPKDFIEEIDNAPTVVDLPDKLIDEDDVDEARKMVWDFLEQIYGRKDK